MDVPKANMSSDLSITLNGRAVQVKAGTSVAAAMMNAGLTCRRSVLGEPRAPLCGMGICMECRATVNGVHQIRTCQVVCIAGMTIETQ